MEITNEVLEERIKGMNALLKEKFSSVHIILERIEKQTTRTNGRVSKLEAWRNRLVGAWVLLLVLVPILIKLVK